MFFQTIEMGPKRFLQGVRPPPGSTGQLWPARSREPAGGSVPLTSTYRETLTVAEGYPTV
jgi:hypothetical protein